MLGDWVRAKNYKQDYTYSTVAILNSKSGEIGCDNHWIQSESVEQIPITDEVLLSQDFKKETVSTICNEYRHNHNGVEVLVRMTNGYSYLEISVLGRARLALNVDYINEIQHALHVCRLGDFFNFNRT